MFPITRVFYVSITTLILFSTAVSSAKQRHFGVLEAVSGENKVQVCASYVTPGIRLADSETDAIAEPLLDLTSFTTCNSDENAVEWFRGRLNSTVVAITWTNCSIVETAQYIQNKNGRGLLIVAPSVLMNLPTTLEMKANNVTITSGIITKNSYMKIKTLGERVLVKEFIPPEDEFFLEYASVVVWILVMLSVTLGCCWETCILLPLNGERNQTYDLSEVSESKHGEVQKSQITNRKENIPMSNGKIQPLATNGVSKVQNESISDADDRKRLGFSILKIVVIIILISIFLILLYFFYDVVVYIIMALFALVATAGMYWCLCTFKFCIPIKLGFTLRGRFIEFREIFLLLCCFGFVTAWILLRKESYGWIFQDILAMFAAIRCISKLQLYNLKVCIVVLVLFFLYTTFLIFGTPPMTPDNQSVMVSLAVGGIQESGVYKEQVPMSIRLPSISFDPLAVCGRREVAVSLIDIVIPGAVVAYCFNFGKQMGLIPCLIYFLGGLSAQGFGLIFTFIAMHALKHGQPALLYIAPCVLLVIIIISLARKEFKSFWIGKPKAMASEDKDDVSHFKPPEEVKMLNPTEESIL